jgi:chemotaxis-related protein WspB
MLFLLFQIGQDRYAIEAQRAVEVVPLLELKKIPQSPPGVAGIVNYRGRPVPAIDLCALTLGRPARAQLSTRIIILRHQNSNGPVRLVGVIAERATELLRREGGDVLKPVTDGARSGFLGPVMMDERGFLQLVRPDNLLPDPVREAIFAQLEAFDYESD